MLRRRGRAGDEAHAQSLEAEALEAASRFDMVALRKKLRGHVH